MKMSNNSNVNTNCNYHIYYEQLTFPGAPKSSYLAVVNYPESCRLV